MRPTASSKSYDGWYLVSVVERFECADPNHSAAESPVWENYHLIQADTVSEAYDKALAWREYEPSSDLTSYDGEKGRWVALGVRELLPIYEPLEHGSEIMWTKHDGLDKESALGLTRKKSEIESEFVD